MQVTEVSADGLKREFTVTVPADDLEQEITRRLDELGRQVRLPGFLIDDNVGLGDVVKRATSAVGFRSCLPCEQRAAALNRWLMFTRS